MFRRNSKTSLDKEISTPLYPGENLAVSSYRKNEGDLPPRLFDPPSSDERKNEEKKQNPLPHHFQGMMKEEPETTLGEGVTFRGQLSFERLLRIDGTFEGELISQGKIVVGPKGKVKANLNLKEAIIEGKIEGNITIQERLELRGEACVYGDITAKLLSVDEGVTICGHIAVSPQEKSGTALES